MNAPTPRESAEREQIARIIADWGDFDFYMENTAPKLKGVTREQIIASFQECRRSLAKADAILALASLTRLRELEEALEPFAKESDRLSMVHWAHPQPDEFGVSGQLLNWGNFRRARLALDGKGVALLARAAITSTGEGI